MGKRRERRNKRNRAAAVGRCPKCGGGLDAGFKFCPYCGLHLKGDDIAEKSVKPVRSENTAPQGYSGAGYDEFGDAFELLDEIQAGRGDEIGLEPDYSDIPDVDVESIFEEGESRC